MTPIAFELTEAEAEVAAARAAWRAALADGLLARHLAPLAAFALILLFAAILGFTGLIPRRSAEIALIVAAAAYMAYRLWTRRRFLQARRAAGAWAASLRAAGPMRVTLEETGLRAEARAFARAWRYEELEFETVAGLVYGWPRVGPPLVWPSRAHADPEAAAAFLARRCAAKPPPTAPDDDD